jgi:hypothetical protein
MISTLLETLISTLASHRDLALENLALRQQIAVLVVSGITIDTHSWEFYPALALRVLTG